MIVDDSFAKVDVESFSVKEDGGDGNEDEELAVPLVSNFKMAQ